ncbi:hypothetical protein ACM67B_08270 [Neisseria sp. CCUG17229]|uniref:hypothetical protein n=1 Tax=Neisseria sp. CCUG17229 TaxID=3392036 RepID=UPI003A0FB937
MLSLGGEAAVCCCVGEKSLVIITIFYIKFKVAARLIQFYSLTLWEMGQFRDIVDNIATCFRVNDGLYKWKGRLEHDVQTALNGLFD